MSLKYKTIEWGMPLTSALLILFIGLFSSGCGGGGSSTATEPATTESATTEPATTEPATTEPATTEPAATLSLIGGTMQGVPLELTGTVTTLKTYPTGTGPYAITTDGTNLYYTIRNQHTIEKMVISTNAVTTLAGTSTVQGSTDGVGAAARFNQPSGITTDGTNLYVSEIGSNNIRKIVIATGEVTTIAGTGPAGSNDGVGTAASFDRPEMILYVDNSLYISDVNKSLLRKISLPDNTVTTVAGQVGVLYTADGTGTAATFDYIDGLTTDGTFLYITDNNPSQTIRKLELSTSKVTTIAGVYLATGSTDGIGAAARFSGPEGIVTDGTNLYISEFDGHTIRKLEISTGNVTTIAGVSGVSGATDGVGTAASFNNLTGIISDGTSLFIVDRGSNAIRKLD